MGDLANTSWSVRTKLSASENHRGFLIIADENWCVADVVPVDEDGIQGREHANLIALAPDMLRCLRALVGDWPDVGDAYMDAKYIIDRIDDTETA